MWRDTLIGADANLHAAIAAIDGSDQKIALVVDPSGKLLGTVTDGDIRRAILRGLDLAMPVTEVLNRNPTTARSGESRDNILALMKNMSLRQIPLLDETDHVVGIEVMDDLVRRVAADNWVVLMAGGRGARLHPLTENVAKPMLPVGNKPLLETILDSFIQYNFRHFYISVNYLADQIKEHFDDGNRWGVEIRYLHEQSELGTAGPLSLIDEVPDSPLIVMNGDLLTDVDFLSLLAFHREQRAVATMAVREFDMEVPFGVVRVEGERIASIDEKPIHRFLINAGIYVLEPSLLSLVPKGEPFDMPEVFDKVVAAGDCTAVFPIREYWLDMGHRDQYLLANKDIRKLFE